MTTEFEVWIDGKKTPQQEAKVSVLDRGFLYGDSVFETLRTYDGLPFALDEHLQRLQESARRVFIDLPCSLLELKGLVKRAVSESAFGDCYVRVMVTRGQAALGLDPRTAVSPLLILIVAPLSPPPPRDYECGISAVSFSAARLGDNTKASGAKIGNYLVAVLGQRKAAEAGAKEALIVTEDGLVIEGATSNLFWMRGQKLCTVPLDAGILAGITRAHLIRVAPQLGLEVLYVVPHLDELLQSDGVFISSSIREILAVVQIDGKPVAGGQVPEIVRRLHQEFRRSARKLAQDDAETTDV